MTSKQLLENLIKRYSECVDIVRVKNQDYATEIDAFKNFRHAALAGVEPERAVLVRISDKMARISNLIDKENAVKDETIQDTINDAINYMAILGAMLEDNAKK